MPDINQSDDISQSDDINFTRRQQVDCAVLRIIAQVMDLKPIVRPADFKRLPGLEVLFMLTPALIKDLGFADEQVDALNAELEADALSREKPEASAA